MLSGKHIKVLSILCPTWLLFATAQGIRITDSAYVIANSGNIVTQGKWINNGKFTANGGTVVFAGSNQQINGTQSSSFNQLSIASGSNTTIVSAGNSVKAILKSDGILNANNQLTLLANAGQTALIDGSGTGEVLGNLTVEGYLSNGYGYKYLGSPFQAATVNEMSEEVDLTAGFGSVWRFDENLASNGWVKYTTSTDTLKPMYGYAFQLGNVAGAKTISMTGVVNNGSLTLTLSNNNQVYTRGFQLVSNPYPSPVNWDAPGWGRTHIDNAIYYFDASDTSQYTGSYKSYINGVSSDGTANNFIPAMQGFFVHVSDGSYPVSGALGFSNATRLTSIATTYRHLNGTNPVPLLRLLANFNGIKRTDAMVVYFQNAATGKFNRQLDALKIMNTASEIPSLYSLAEAGEPLSIHAVPNPDTSSRIPLGIQTIQDGMVTISAGITAAIPVGISCYLYDAVTGKYNNLKENKSYECYLPAGVYEKRFFLVFSQKPVTVTATTEPATERFLVSGTGRNVLLTLHTAPGEKSVIRIINTAGQVLYNRTYTQGGNYPLSLLVAAGIYYAVCITSDSIITKKIFL